MAAGCSFGGATYAPQGQLPEAVEWSLADGAFVDMSLKGVGFGSIAYVMLWV